MTSKIRVPCEDCPLGATRNPCRPTDSRLDQLEAAGNWRAARVIIRCQDGRIDGGVVKDGLTRLDTFPLLKARVEARMRVPPRRRGELVRKGNEAFLPALALIFDGDGFGDLNKKHSYFVGDRGILALANLVGQITRPEDEDFFGLPDRPDCTNPSDAPDTASDGEGSDNYNARRGGDEFVAFLFGIPNAGVAAAKASQVREICKQGTTLWVPDGVQLHLTASVGAAYVEQPREARDVFWALHLAGVALNDHKTADLERPAPALAPVGPTPADYDY